jgi:hypothetical protein
MRILIFSICLLFTETIFSQNWTGAADANWNNSANWSGWPLNGQDIVINPSFYSGNAVAPVISANSTFSPASVLIENGGSLTISANLTTQDDVEVTGPGSSLSVDNGTFNVNPSNGGRLIIDLGGSMAINGGITYVDERFIVGADAVVTINNGTANSGERIVMDLGGKIIQNGGTVSVAQTFAMTDGSAGNGSGYEMNGGTLTITGEMAFENEAGNFEPTFLMTAGTLSVNGDVTWFGTSPGSGTPRFILQGGSASISGLIQNLALSTVDLYLKIGGNSSLNFSGTLIETLHTTDSILQTDNSTFTISNTNTFNNMGVVHAADNTTTIFTGSSILDGSGSYQLHNLSIDSLSQVNHFNPPLIKVSGNFSKDGNFNANANTLELNGSQQQTILGSNPLQLHNLTLENTAAGGVDLLLPVNISGHLQLNNGVVHTSGNSLISIENNATSSTGNPGSFVSGPVEKTGDEAFVFPTGKDSVWRRVEMSAPSSSTSTFRAEYFNTSYLSISPVSSPLNSVSNIEYWQLSQQNETDTVRVKLYWEDASASAITDCNNLSIAHWNNTTWENVLSTASGTCSGTGNGNIVSSSEVQDFGIFTFGFYSGVTSQNITLCQGDSMMVGNNVYSSSGTYIDVLQDTSMNDSVVITNLTVINLNTVIGMSGNHLQSNIIDADTYQWLNCSNNTPIGGATNPTYIPVVNGSYSLVVTKSGCTDTSECYQLNSVGMEDTSQPGFIVYPNPFLEVLTVSSIHSVLPVEINITDVTGKIVFTMKAANSKGITPITTNLAPGIYFLNLITETTTSTVKVIKQ